jgi:hypothetical protein
VVWNVLNYGQITNQVRTQDAEFQQAVPSYQNTVLQAQQEVEDAVVSFLAFILGVLPLVFASGADANARRSIGITVASGMLASTASRCCSSPPSSSCCSA